MVSRLSIFGARHRARADRTARRSRTTEKTAGSVDIGKARWQCGASSARLARRHAPPAKQEPGSNLGRERWGVFIMR